MSPEERQLIVGLFDRMRGLSLGEKDGEAEALINERIEEQRDAPYMLVQSVLVQEQALQRADARIRELEAEVRSLQGSAQQGQAASGGFLGGPPGSRPAGAEPPRGSSVPAVGARATSPQPAPQPAGARQPGGGGFLQSAMATAVGVAGGMLAAGAIGSLLGGGSPASAATPPQAGDPQASDPQAAAGNDGGAAEPPPQQPADEGATAQDAADDGGWFGGDWFGGDGGDFDL